jgi:NADH-quinone oxidoreductase subunit M
MIPFAPYVAVGVPILLGSLLLISVRLVRNGLLSEFLNTRSGWISVASLAASLIAIMSVAADIVSIERIEEYVGWVPSLGIRFGFLLDQVNVPIGLIMATVSLVVCLYSVEYTRPLTISRAVRIYYGCLLIFVASMIAVVLSDDLVQFYLFWEAMLIPSYFLITVWGMSDKRLEIGFKYFIFTHIGAIAMLLGILATYAYTNTLNLPKLITLMNLIPEPMTSVIFVLLILGFYVKMAIFPVHTWLPDAHSEAPTPISALLSGLMIKCGAYGIVRLITPMFKHIAWDPSTALMVLAAVTMVYGGAMAIAQTDIKRFLAYSSISQMGYIAFGLASDSRLGITGSVLHIINHAIGKSLLFLISGIIIEKTGTRDISRMGGLAQRMPITTVTFLVGALSLSGIPPLSGFWSEWLIFAGGLSTGKVAITVFALISTVLTAGYYLWASWRIFFGPLREDLREATDPPWQQSLPLLLLAFIVITIGVYPEAFMNHIVRGVEHILGARLPG